MKDVKYCGLAKPTKESLHQNYLLMFSWIDKNGNEARKGYGFETEADARNAEAFAIFILNKGISVDELKAN